MAECFCDLDGLSEESTGLGVVALARLDDGQLVERGCPTLGVTDFFQDLDGLSEESAGLGVVELGRASGSELV